MVFNNTKQYNMHVFDKIIFFKYRQDKSKLQKQIRKLLTTVSITISNFLTSFCIFDLSNSILEKYNFIKKILYCLIK